MFVVYEKNAIPEWVIETSEQQINDRNATTTGLWTGQPTMFK